MIDLTPSEQTQWVNQRLRIEDALEKTFSKLIAPAINRSYIDAAKSVGTSGVGVNTNAIVSRNSRRVRKILENRYKRTGSVFFRITNNRINELDLEKSFESYKTEIVEWTEQFSWDCGMIQKTFASDFWVEFNVWSETEAATKVKFINKTTQKSIAKIISNGTKNNLTPSQIATELRKTGKIASRTRALRIARTETHTATSHSIQTAISNTREDMEKSWFDVGDKRVRTDHALVGGGWIDIQASFIVGGQKMEYPGDPAGGADQVVHCRCSALYQRKGVNLRDFANSRDYQLPDMRIILKRVA